MLTFCWLKSGERSETSKASPSSKPSVSSARKSAENALYIHLTLVPSIASAGRAENEADAAQRP